MHNKIKIAVVDDDEVFHLIIQKQMEMTNWDFEIDTFYNGQEALDYLNSKASNIEDLPKIIMLDINMPLKDGWEFLEEYDHLPPKTKNSINLFMVTSSVIQADIDKAKKDKNLLEFISKPVSEEVLEKMLNWNGMSAM